MKYDNLYMDLAVRVSQESKCPRKAVGCVIVQESGMLSVGFNGMASGGTNILDYSEEGNQEVVHAVVNRNINIFNRLYIKLTF